MKAVIFRQHGGPSVLEYADVETPTPAPHEVLVRVKACALNHLDIWIRQGNPAYPLPLPHISGSDVAGVVEQVGSQVQDVTVGTNVFVSPGISCWHCEACLAGRDNFCKSYTLVGALTKGGYAEYVTVPAMNAIPLPDHIPFEQGAAFPLVSVTARHMLVTLAQLRSGESVLIMGAGSGVGSMAVQMAKLVGARVITTVGSDEKIPKAGALGADEVLNHSTQDVVKSVMGLTKGAGVDVVIEHIGPQVWDQCFSSLAKGGRLITCGATTGAEVTLSLRALFSRQLTIKGSYMGTRAELLEAAKLIGQGKLKPVVDRVFPLRDARAAQELMLARKFFGKLVLAVD
ncbi:MAG: alcohol dehydrogenase [Nitrospira sp.]|nr:MAG: alcohol dehydrogenase [Nitrospira sp.]